MQNKILCLSLAIVSLLGASNGQQVIENPEPEKYSPSEITPKQYDYSLQNEVGERSSFLQEDDETQNKAMNDYFKHGYHSKRMLPSDDSCRNDEWYNTGGKSICTESNMCMGDRTCR